MRLRIAILVMMPLHYPTGLTTYSFSYVYLNYLMLIAYSFLLHFPAIMDVLLSQRCGKILVGDPHQQIYTFRGAVNALNIVHHTHIFYLTQVITHSKIDDLFTEAAKAFKL